MRTSLRQELSGLDSLSQALILAGGLLSLGVSTPILFFLWVSLAGWK